MTAATLLQTLHDRGVSLSVSGDRLRYNAPQGAMTEELAQALRTHKHEVMALLAHPAPLFDDDNHAKLHAAGYLVSPDGEAEAQLSRQVSVLLLKGDNGVWQLVKARWSREGGPATETVIIQARDLGAVVKRAVSYLSWARQGGERS